MKKRAIFGVVLIVLGVLCTLSVLQVRNVLANHRQNERDDSTDDSFYEYPHDLVLPHLPEFKDNEPVDTMDEETNDIKEFHPIIIKPRIPGLAYDDIPNDTYLRGLLYNYEPYYIHEGWNYIEKYTPKRGHAEVTDTKNP